MRNRGISSVPKWTMIDSRPLWPPGAALRSQAQAVRAAARDRRARREFRPARSCKNCATAASGSPLRFMKLVGLTRMPRPLFAQSASHFLRMLPGSPHRRPADRGPSKPTLWRVALVFARRDFRARQPGECGGTSRPHPLSSAKRSTIYFFCFFFLRGRCLRAAAAAASGSSFFSVMTSGPAARFRRSGHRLFFHRRRQDREGGEIRLEPSSSHLAAT